jgi:bifunctional non-homologous end joining protein LigD
MRGMLKHFDFALPTKGIAVPSSSAWLHDVKHDGYRIMVIRDGTTFSERRSKKS